MKGETMSLFFNVCMITFFQRKLAYQKDGANHLLLSYEEKKIK